MRFVIVGASAGLGRALAEEAASRAHDLLLVATDASDLRALTADLRNRFEVDARYICADLGDPLAIDTILVAVHEFGVVDGLLLPVGFAVSNDDGTLDFPTAQRIVNINFVSVLKLVQSLWNQLRDRPDSWVVGFGSIAGIRGRTRNVVYAAAKRALLTYFESLRHLAVGTSIVVQCYILGYLDTQQTFGKRLLFPKASPRALAKRVFDRLDDGGSAVFYPWFWSIVARILRTLPWMAYKRLRF